MANYWLKIYKEDKIAAERAVKGGAVSFAGFVAAAQEICGQLDIPTPLILPVHFKSLDKFNYVKLLPSDFIEQVNFDYVTFEVF